jgi:hypothetical protein
MYSPSVTMAIGINYHATRELLGAYDNGVQPLGTVTVHPRRCPMDQETETLQKHRDRCGACYCMP